jgi:NTE family protein
MVERALVLGGGGPVGIAWEIGLAAGLAENRITLARADRIIGTSAGSFVGAALASGRAPDSLLKSQIEQGERDRAPRSPSSGERPKPPDLMPLMRMMARRPETGEVPRDLLIELGAFALQAKTIPEENFIASFGGIAKDATAWPKGYGCTAVDAESGEFKVWDESAGVALGRAIASSCSVPGVFPPITINGRRYVDGGMRSGTNIDLVKGANRVLAVIVESRMTTDAMRKRVREEIAEVEREGGKVETVVPNAECIEVFGANLMDASRRGDVAKAGARQGRAEAERLRGFWS